MTVETRDLTKYYWMGKEKVVALDGVDLKMEEGVFISVVGPSGSGKSTLLNVIGCLDAPTKGEVYLAGWRVDYRNKKSLVRLRRKFVGFAYCCRHGDFYFVCCEKEALRSIFIFKPLN